MQKQESIIKELKMKKYIVSLLAMSALVANDKVVLDKASISGESFQETAWELLEYQSQMPTKNVSLIGEKQLLESSSGSGGIQSILERIAGITYARTSGLGGNISIRGQNTRNGRSIIAIDGVRVNGRTELEFDMIDPLAIQSIEIIRGAASSMYGSNAMNGVINFKTRRWMGDVSAPFKMDAKIRGVEVASVNNALGGRAEVLGGGDGWDVLVGLTGRKASDFRTPAGVAKESKYHSYGTDFNIGYTKNAIRYYLSGKYYSVSNHEANGLFSRPGTSYGFTMSEDPLREIYLKMGVEAYELAGFADKMDWYAYWRRWDTDIYNQLPNGQYRHRKVYNNNYVGGRLNLDKTLKSHSLSYGIDVWSSISPTQLRDEVIRPNPRVILNSRDTYQVSIAPYIKDDYYLNEAWILSGSLRYDYYKMKMGKKKSTTERMDTTLETTRFLDSHSTMTTGALTGNLGATYFINDKFSLNANISQDFKSQGTTGMFPNYGASIQTLANLDLKPETGQTYEIGAKFADKNHYSSLNFYRTNYTDMIALQSLNATTQQYQNIGKAYVQGIELESVHRFLEKWNLQLVGAYTYGQDKTANKPLAYIAPFSGSLSLGYDFLWGSLSWIQRLYLGKKRINNTQERESKTYTMSDIKAVMNLGYFKKDFKDMEMIVGVENLFNTKGRNPATQENINYSRALTNPLLEPGINAFMKFAYKY